MEVEQLLDQLDDIILKFKQLSIMTEVTMQDAVQRLVNNDTANTQKITSLERQLDDLVKSFEDYRVQNEETTKNQIV